MKIRVLKHVAGLLIFADLSCTTPNVSAADSSLIGQIDQLFGENGLELSVEPGRNPQTGEVFPPHTAHFSSTSLATLGALSRTLAASSADFPVVSTVPGFTFRYNPDIQAFEPATGNSGSVFVERGRTLGQGKFDFGVSYLYIDYQELNGQDLDKLSFRGLTHQDCCPPNSPGVPEFENQSADVTFSRFNLSSNVISLFGTYGITDRWDFNILLPIIVTDMDIQAQAQINSTPGVNPAIHVFPNGSKTTTRSVRDTKAGVGDLQLRTKYYFGEWQGFHVAGLLRLRIPTGDENNFQGWGDTTLAPYFAINKQLADFDFHVNAGVDIDFENSDRSRVRYAAGLAYQFMERAAFLVDVIGSSNISDETISVQVPQFQTSTTAPFTTSIASYSTVNQKFKTDIVDLAVGFKTNPYKSMAAYVNFIVPLTNDGLRADFIPAVGLEMTY
jgi:hypothetical protein